MAAASAVVGVAEETTAAGVLVARAFLQARGGSSALSALTRAPDLPEIDAWTWYGTYCTVQY